MLAELDSTRYERLVEDASGALRRGRPPGSPPILEVAPGLLADRHKKVMKRVKRVSGSSPFEELHDLRKKGRRLRYAVEPLVEIYGKPATKMVEQLKKLQDVFGEQQDRTVAAELLEEVALSGDLPPEAVFYMGAEAERRRREAEDMRREIPKAKALRAVRNDDDWKRLRKAMNERLPESAKKG
jgi:CHAD domain-containing protein